MDRDYIKLFEPIPPGEYLEIREDYKNSVWISNIEELKKYVIDKNKDIFIQQFTKGDNKNRKGENSKSIKHLFFDIDHIKNLKVTKVDKLKMVLNDIRCAGLPKPTIILVSGGGYHVYFELKKRIYKDITPVLKKLALKINADTRATDKARIMRLEGSINQKEGYNKPKIEVIYKSGFTYDLEIFEKISKIKAKKIKTLDNNYRNSKYTSKKTNKINKSKKDDKKINESKNGSKKINKNDFRHSKLTKDIITNMNCVNEMLKGVSEGQRNFALGRITKKLKQMGYQEYIAKKIIMSWNTDNKPPEDESKLIADFEAYWKNGYKLLGCQFNNFELQENLKLFCDKTKCNLRKNVLNIEKMRENLISYPNELIKKNKYHKISGNSLIIFGVLKYHNGFLDRESLKEKLKNNISNKYSISPTLLSKKFKEELEKLKLIKIEKRYKKEGGRKSDLIKLEKNKKFNLGYTLISYSVIEKFIDGTITQAEFKVYLLLMSYIYTGKDKAWPNQEKMADILRITQQTLSEHLKKLEAKKIIQIEHIRTEKGYPKCVYKIGIPA